MRVVIYRGGGVCGVLCCGVMWCGMWMLWVIGCGGGTVSVSVLV